MATTKKKPVAKKKAVKKSSQANDAAAIAKRMRAKADNEGCVFC